MRRVRRVIRKIDPWTVLKVSFILNLVGALAFVLGSVIFWAVFVNAGIPDKIGELAELLTLTFTADGPTYFRVVVLLAVIGTILLTGFFTLAAIMYNLIADIVGGVEVVVLEETIVPVARRRRREPVTPAVAQAAAEPSTGSASRLVSPQEKRISSPVVTLDSGADVEPVAGGARPRAR
ncbi:MAG: DUF3566 domain-containing protein [Acidimicrobiia bacterium]